MRSIVRLICGDRICRKRWVRESAGRGQFCHIIRTIALPAKSGPTNSSCGNSACGGGLDFVSAFAAPRPPAAIPIVGGLMVGAHLPLAAIFAVFAVPLIAAAAMTLRISIKQYEY